TEIGRLADATGAPRGNTLTLWLRRPFRSDLPVPCLAKPAISVLGHHLSSKAEVDMTASLKAMDGSADLPALMNELAVGARAAARVLPLAPPEQKNRALAAMERAIRKQAAAILAANAEDVAEVRAGGATSAFIDRLTLTQARVDAIADGI